MFGQFHRTFSVFVIVQRERLCLSSRCRRASFAVFGWSSSWKWQSNKTFGLCWTSLPEQGAFTQRSTSASVWWKHMLKVFQPTSHLVSVPRRCRYRRYNLHFFKTSHFVATLCESSWLNLRCIYDNLIFYKSEYIKWTQPMFDKHATNFQRYIFLRNVDVLFKSYLAGTIRFLW